MILKVQIKIRNLRWLDVSQHIKNKAQQKII